MHYSNINTVKFAWEGYHYFKNWEEHIGVKDERGYARLREIGSVIMRTEGATSFLNKVIPLWDQVGIPYEIWDRHRLEKCFEGLNFDLRDFGPAKKIEHEAFGEGGTDITSAFYAPLTGYVSDPHLATLNLQLAAEATGHVEFRFGQSVTAIKKDSDGRIAGVRLESGQVISAPVVVNVAGPKSSQVTAMAFDGVDPALNDMRISTKAVRHEVAYLRSPPGVPKALAEEGVGMPLVTDLDTGVYIRPEVGGKILIGGLEADCDHPHDFVDDADAVNPSLTDWHTNYAYRAGLRMPELQMPSAADTQGIVACYDVTEDWTPIYDKSLIRGYYMAIGTSGNQFKNAGVAGAMMAELITRCEEDPSFDHDATPLQFNLEKTGCGTLDAAVFSRKRELQESSFSVLG